MFWAKGNKQNSTGRELATFTKLAGLWKELSGHVDTSPALRIPGKLYMMV